MASLDRNGQPTLGQRLKIVLHLQNNRERFQNTTADAIAKALKADLGVPVSEKLVFKLAQECSPPLTVRRVKTSSDVVERFEKRITDAEKAVDAVSEATAEWQNRFWAIENRLDRLEEAFEAAVGKLPELKPVGAF